MPDVKKLGDFRFGSKADLTNAYRDVRFVPLADISASYSL
jgi:hypothetical protein